MKKLLTTLFALYIAIALSACGAQDSTPKKETVSESTADISSSKKQDESFGLNDSAVFENLKITAVDLEESKGKDFFNADEGKVFVGVKFEIENVSDEPQSISSLMLFDAYSDDVKCTYSLSANVVFGEGTLDGELAPQKKLVGWYAVEAPEDWQQLELDVKASWLSNSKAKFIFNK